MVECGIKLLSFLYLDQAFRQTKTALSAGKMGISNHVHGRFSIGLFRKRRIQDLAVILSALVIVVEILLMILRLV